jgi:hypothetical protein
MVVPMDEIVEAYCTYAEKPNAYYWCKKKPNLLQRTSHKHGTIEHINIKLTETNRIQL